MRKAGRLADFDAVSPNSSSLEATGKVGARNLLTGGGMEGNSEAAKAGRAPQALKKSG